MAWLSTAIGILLIAVTLRDVFHQLFHPTARGTISARLQSGVFGAFRRVTGGRRDWMSLAGPTGVVILLTWGALAAVGWALVYLPHLPSSFRVASGIETSAASGFGTALYLSLVTLATLGYGDISPTVTWLRVIAPLEAFTGFALLSAGITWVLSLFPVLVRTRAFALEIHVIAETFASSTDLARLGASRGAAMMAMLRSGTIRARADMVHFTAMKYFVAAEPRSSLAGAVSLLEALSRAGQDPSMPDPVRLEATTLARAVAELTELVEDRDSTARARETRRADEPA